MSEQQRQNRDSVTWLHLSDLHACSARTGWDSRRITDTLTEDLQRISSQHGLYPDLVFFSGDLVFGQLGAGKGKNIADQFDEGAVFLDAVRNSFQPTIPKDRVFIVPGNHDVNRDEVSDDQIEWLDRCDDLSKVLKHIDLPTRQWGRYMERLNDYRRFLERYEYGHLLKDPQRLIYSTALDVRCVTVGIAGFNSAWSCGRNGEIGRLWIGGRWQLGHLTQSLEQTDLTIALIHHPGSWYVEQENPSFWRAMQQEFSVSLHGHEHLSWLTPLDDHTTIAAGACYENSQRPTGYNFARVRPREGRGEVWFRKYDDRGRKWVTDIVAGRNENPAGVWEFTNTRLYRNPKIPWSPTRLGKLVACERIVAFCRGSDGYTARITEIIDSYKVPWKLIDITSDVDIQNAIAKWNELPLPQVYMGGAFVGGSDELDRLHRENKLASLIREALV